MGNVRFQGLTPSSSRCRMVQMRLPVPPGVDVNGGVKVVCLAASEEEHKAKSKLSNAIWQVSALNATGIATGPSVTLSKQVAGLATHLCDKGWGLIDGFLHGTE